MASFQKQGQNYQITLSATELDAVIQGLFGHAFLGESFPFSDTLKTLATDARAFGRAQGRPV